MLLHLLSQFANPFTKTIRCYIHIQDLWAYRLAVFSVLSGDGVFSLLVNKKRAACEAVTSWKTASDSQSE